jgi:uncharacterized protein HemY
MSPGRVLVVIGVVLVGVGLLVQAFPSLGRLPGDVRIERPGFTLYVPIATSLLFSVVISLVLYFLSRR